MRHAHGEPGIAPSAVVESSVVVDSTAMIEAHAAVIGQVEIGARVSVGVGAVVDGASGRIVVRDGAVLGPNCTLVGPLTIDREAHVRSGAVVSDNVPACAVVEGNPAVIVDYRDTSADSARPVSRPAVLGAQPKAGARLVEFTEARDLRGDLAVGNFPDQVPFVPARFFLVYGVTGKHVRGAHAHRQCEQFLIAVHGSLSVVVDDGAQRDEIVLDRPTVGLYLPPMTWGVQYKHSPDAVLLVFASHRYDPDDYVRDYSDFVQLVGIRAEEASGPGE